MKDDKGAESIGVSQKEIRNHRYEEKVNDSVGHSSLKYNSNCGFDHDRESSEMGMATLDTVVDNGGIFELEF
eukprot:CAMPEP_0197833100 /NCGR_PEP_ID=MMETSP1437-20131217/17743_1 /TAXON_ID=49252 ORGANISM="Eucampia antarctica, Strain CCMP1452" /NCGR_SAMPLE_ID=MMETSP1437 /ASSEMBLY_ACC=CAM_ASM_001096 /LENGTH=71 /DNA_ID=CAMNT_0043436933 /DNA_START=132 /DNA_END=347 /DNA_ORIENTATION=-